MSTTEDQAEKKPKLEINKGVELMLRNKKLVKKRREPRSFQFIAGQNFLVTPIWILMETKDFQEYSEKNLFLEALLQDYYLY